MGYRKICETDKCIDHDTTVSSVGRAVRQGEDGESREVWQFLRATIDPEIERLEKYERKNYLDRGMNPYNLAISRLLMVKNEVRDFIKKFPDA